VLPRKWLCSSRCFFGRCLCFLGDSVFFKGLVVFLEEICVLHREGDACVP
jgi:hypothetical protein